MRPRTALLSLLLCVSICADAGNRLQEHLYRPAWTPFSTLENSATLVGYWDAASYKFLTDDGAGAISSWKDQKLLLSMAATTTARPTWSATSFNSAYPGMTCDGATDAPTTTTFTNLPTGSTPGDIFVFANVTNTGAQQNLVTYGNNAASTGRQIRIAASGTASVSDNTAVLNNSGAITGIHLISAEWSGTTERGYQDGTEFPTSPMTIATLNTGAVRTRFCSSNGAGAANFAAATFAFIVYTSGNLSTADRQRFEGFFWWSNGLAGSGLPLTHPYKYAPP